MRLTGGHRFYTGFVISGNCRAPTDQFVVVADLAAPKDDILSIDTSAFSLVKWKLVRRYYIECGTPYAELKNRRSIIFQPYRISQCHSATRSRHSPGPSPDPIYI